MLTGACWCVSGPIYVYFMYGIRTTTIEVKFPFVDDPNMEYKLNMTMQFVVFVHGGFVYQGMEPALMIFTDFIKIFPKIIKLKLNELNEQIFNKKVSEAQIRLIFKNIVNQSHDHDK